MATHIHLSKDAAAVADDFTRYFLEQLAGKTHFTVALSGGSTPQLLFKLWATTYRDQINWSAVHFFWGDERCVAPDHADSNYGVTRALLLDHVPIPASQIHRIHGEADPAQEAVRYAQVIREHTQQVDGHPAFDLVLLGMGDDGHTASIFPDHLELLQDEHPTAVATHPQSGQLRISITGPVINGAQRVAFLVTGAGKHEKVSAILGREAGCQAFPAAHIQPATGELHWFLDAAAWGKS